MTRESFFDLLCETYFLQGIEKSFIDFIKKHGAHCYLPGNQIENSDNQELIQILLLMLWKNQIPSFSLTISA